MGPLVWSDIDSRCSPRAAAAMVKTPSRTRCLGCNCVNRFQGEEGGIALEGLARTGPEGSRDSHS